MNGMDVIKRMHGYARWSRGLVLDGIEGLSHADREREFPIGMGSLWKSVVHVYGADLGWLGVLERDPDHDFSMDTPADLASLRAAWAALDARWDVCLDALDDAKLDEVITRNSAQMNTTYHFRTGDVCLHVCTHAVHTMAQCRNMLRSCGVEEQPKNDLIFCPGEAVAGGLAGAEPA